MGAALANRKSCFAHILTVVVESASQVNCNQGVCKGADEGGVRSVMMVAHCLSVISDACSLLNKQILVRQSDILSPSWHSFTHDYWLSGASNMHISSRKLSCSDFLTNITMNYGYCYPDH